MAAAKPLGFFQRITKFIGEVRQEFLKVTWPSQRETVTTTIMVFIMVILAATFFFFVDLILRSLVSFLLS